MSKKARILILLCLGLVVWLALAIPAAASNPALPPAQVLYQTPTAGGDGRILYTVKKNDTCISISLLNNVSLDELRRLNNLSSTECAIREGQQLLLGVVVKTTPTIGPSPTPTPILPTGTPFAGTGEICVVLFEDINGNARADSGENFLADGTISLSERKGKVNLSGITSANADAPKCFLELSEGEYNISVASPQGYNPTTSMNQSLKLQAGDRSIVDFGAQQSLRSPPPAQVQQEGRSPLLAIVGVVLILVGLGLGLYLRFFSRK